MQTLENRPNLDTCFDWVQVTFQNTTIDEVLFNISGVDKEHSSCTFTDKGSFGYNRTYTVGSKMHFMEHSNRKDMGIHLLFSGSACREYEQLFTWDYFFQAVSRMSGKYTRIDVAIDCFKKYFTVNQLKNKIKKAELVSKFKKSTYITEYNLSNGTSNSASLKFGSMSSDIYIVIYDKLAERKNGGYEVNKNLKFWTRCEIRFKKDLANSLACLYLTNKNDLNQFIYDILYNYLDFKEPCSDKNRSRWETSNFWKTFLGDCRKLEISQKAYQTSIQKKKNYAEMKLSKLLSMVCVCENDFYNNLITKGLEKITVHDLNIINSHLIENNNQVLTMQDIDHILHDFKNNHGKKSLELYPEEYNHDYTELEEFFENKYPWGGK